MAEWAERFPVREFPSEGTFSIQPLPALRAPDTSPTVGRSQRAPLDRARALR